MVALKKFIARLLPGRRPPAGPVVQSSLDPLQFAPVPDGGYLVGGAVRDALLGRDLVDLDWLVAQPERAASVAAGLVEGAHFALDEARGHWRVVTRSSIRDYIRLDTSLEADLKSRDFTINSLAMTETGRIIDVQDGLADLKAGVLRMNARQNLEADPVRLLRGVRLANQLDFRLDEDTAAAIRQLAPVLPLPAWERVRVELDLIIMSPTPARGMRLLDSLGLLELYLPELTAGRGIEQGSMHHLDVLEHQIESLGALAAGFPEADLTLRWATLLHDIGKPLTHEHLEDDRPRFHGHAEEGSRLARQVMLRLRQPTARQERVAELVLRHMLPLPEGERSARRYVHRYGHILEDLLKLMIADRESARGRQASEAGRNRYRVALGRLLGTMKQHPPEPPLLDGNQLMRLLGIPAGPRVGEAARYLAELQAVGDADSVEEAEKHLRTYAEAQGWYGRQPQES